MFRKLINYIAVAKLGLNNTTNEVFQQYQGYARTGINGNAGFTVMRSMRATDPAGIVPGPSHKLNDPSFSGNVPYTVNLQPLTDENLKAI